MLVLGMLTCGLVGGFMAYKASIWMDKNFK